MVNKTTLRLTFRKMRSHIPQLTGLILLLIVGVCFYITLFTIVLRYEETAEQYFIDNAYADATLLGAFDNESVNRLSQLDGVLFAQGRTVRDYRDKEQVIRAVSLTDGINIPYLYDGRLPTNEAECILLRRNAEVMGLSIGDTLMIDEKSLTITGLAASPEYIYLAQNERTMMAQPDSFGVVYVTETFFVEGYNEIVMLTDEDFSVSDTLEEVDAVRTVLQKDQLSYTLYRNDLDELRSFAYIFPSVFAVLIAVVIYVMLSRTIQKDRRQIGTMKALGLSDRKIIVTYLSQSCFTALAGALLGCVAAIAICDFIISIFSSMFEVPTLSFAFYPGLWLMAILVSILLCIVSGLIALCSILLLLPSVALRPRVPKGGGRILLERIGFLWKWFSFNTRYALKNSFRNKSRFFAVVLGMCGSCALFAFSLGFYDSIGNTQDKYFHEFANYDVIAHFDPVPLIMEHPAEEQIEESKKALVLHVDIQDETYILAITENDFDMVFISNEALQSGIIIPEYFADIWDVRVGDTLEINGHDLVRTSTSSGGLTRPYKGPY